MFLGSSGYETVHDPVRNPLTGNNLYERFLDPSTFSYTCALWREPERLHFISNGQFFESPAKSAMGHGNMTLDQAQLNKIHLLIKKGNIQKHHRVLELGCGFGGFSCELAKKVGCRVDCYNLSVEQLALARARAEKAGVGHLINYMHDDYRHCVNYRVAEDGKALRARALHEDYERYDVIVSIGMLEHVGSR